MNSSVAERHDLVRVAAVGAIVLVVEGDAVLVERDQPAVRDGDAVGVARQIGEHRLGSGERWLGRRRTIRACAAAPGRRRRPALGEVGMLAEEVQLAGVVRGTSFAKHQPAEQLGEPGTGSKKRGPARHPP